MNQNWSYSLDTLNLGQSQRFFVSSELEIRHMASKNNREPLLCCFKFGASLQSHGFIKTGVTVGTQPIWVEIDEFCPVWPWNLIMILKNANLRDLITAIGLVILVKLDSNRQLFSPCDLEIWWWPWKTIGHFFYTMSSICIISNRSVNSNWSYSGNAKFRLKLLIFCSVCITLKPWVNSN